MVDSFLGSLLGACVGSWLWGWYHTRVSSEDIAPVRATGPVLVRKKGSVRKPKANDDLKAWAIENDER